MPLKVENAHTKKPQKQMKNEQKQESVLWQDCKK